MKARLRMVIYITAVIVAISGVQLAKKLFLSGAISPGMALVGTIGSVGMYFMIIVIGLFLLLAEKLSPSAKDRGTEIGEYVHEEREQTKRAIEKDVPREKSMPPVMDASQDEWFKWYDQVTGGSSVKPAPPVDENSPKDMWFHWYHYVTDVQGYKMTLKELAQMMGLAYGTLRKAHSGYQAQYGEQT